MPWANSQFLLFMIIRHLADTDAAMWESNVVESLCSDESAVASSNHHSTDESNGSHPQPNKKRRSLHQSVKPPDKKKARGEEATAEEGDEIKNNEQLNPVPPPERSELEGKLQALPTEEEPSEQKLENLKRAQKKYRDMVKSKKENQSKKEHLDAEIRYGPTRSIPDTEIQEMKAKRMVLMKRLTEIEATRGLTQSELENIREEITGTRTVSSRTDPVEWGTHTPVTTEDEDGEDDSEEEMSD